MEFSHAHGSSLICVCDVLFFALLSSAPPPPPSIFHSSQAGIGPATGWNFVGPGAVYAHYDASTAAHAPMDKVIEIATERARTPEVVRFYTRIT